MSGYERRDSVRVPCLAVGIETSGRMPRAVRATNISEGGAYIRCLEGGVLLEGEALGLELRFSDGHTLWARGRVVEQVEETLFDGAAVVFEVMPYADRERLRAFVQAAHWSRARHALTGLRAALGYAPATAAALP